MEDQASSGLGHHCHPHGSPLFLLMSISSVASHLPPPVKQVSVGAPSVSSPAPFDSLRTPSPAEIPVEAPSFGQSNPRVHGVLRPGPRHWG